jgi:murein DD-endopeptidase MepM/ murein hydrolase activator NlpD
MSENDNNPPLAADHQAVIEDAANSISPPDLGNPMDFDPMSAGSSEPELQQTQPRNDRPFLRWLVTLVMIAVLGVLGYLIFQRVVAARAQPAPETASTTLPVAPVEASDSGLSIDSVPYQAPVGVAYAGIQRRPEFKTTIPDRPRVDVITYTVQQGDTLFEIADKYGIQPETLLWGNFETLKDNPHFLKEGQVLNILPVNGTYYQWHDGDSLEGVASSFKVEAQAIIDFAGNPFDLTTLNTSTFGLQPGLWIVVPGGKRPIKDWGPPTISRSNPAAARYYGAGSCGEVYEGAIGNGTFVWPAVSRDISGYTYSGIHPGIDIGGSLGSPIFAVDNGVVVYSGWSDYGYGYMVVVDHGNGFQSAYAHLSAINVGCGQSVFQGSTIGGLGSTGNSSGPHLHFELSINGAKPNPLDYIR